MTSRRRRSLALLAVAATCALPAGSALATPDPDNAATAIIEQDDGRAADVAWDVSRRRGDEPVLNRNSATARAHCLRCRATAIAFQIVLVSGSPGTVGPQNTAEALNFECPDCQAVAEARQFVRVVPSRMRLTGEGRARLAGVHRRLEELAAQDLPAEQIHQAVESEEAEVSAVLRDDLVIADDEDPERRALQDSDLG